MYSSTPFTRAVDLSIAARWCFRFPEADGLEKTGSLSLYLSLSLPPPLLVFLSPLLAAHGARLRL
jgi:uncharacterized BrkB/YihY/UPF0761 family membrane protein